MSEPDYDVIPTLLHPDDPSRGPLPVTLRAEAHLELARRVDDMLSGLLPPDDPQSEALATRLGVARPPRHDRSRPEVLPVRLDDDLMADITEDLLPDHSLLSERFIGDPFAPITTAILAAMAWLPGVCRGRRVIDIWSADDDDRRMGTSARLLGRCPPNVYVDGVPLLDVYPTWIPPKELVPGPIGVGRACRVEGGWAWSAWMPLPGRPGPEPLRRRLRWAGWLLALDNPSMTAEDVLRSVPDVVYRAAVEGAKRALRGTA